MWYIVSLGFIWFLYFKYYFISIINSHFGTNLTTEEADKFGTKKNNFISRFYNKLISSYYTNFKNEDIKSELPPIINITDLTKDKFIKLTKNFTSPLVVKGFFKDSYAVQNWNLEYFETEYGEIELPTIEDANIKHIQSKISNDTYMSNHKYVKLKDVIENIRKKGNIYVNNVSRIFGYRPELLDNLNLETTKKYAGVDLKNSTSVTHMFLGGKNTGTTLHCSYTGNFFFNVKGKKKWHLIHPKYSMYLLPTLSRSGLFAVSKTDIFNKKDITEKIPRYEFELDEGDLLFNPPWWWHAVKNESEYTIGCANRYTNMVAAIKNNPLYTFIFYSHPICNLEYGLFGLNKDERNKKFDEVLLQDMLRKNKKI